MKGIRITLATAACLVGLALAPAPAAADFVIIDDLIVDGSACIGFDCVNGEVFSFDTVRLKENNLRIAFIDTSTAASFPRGDWQLRANDSANGGANRFSIDWLGTSATSGNGIVRTPFTIEGNAPSNSLYVDDGGRLGIKTAVPSVELHIKDGDTPTLRLEQDSSSGFEPQTWDVAGNETNFFVRDVTNGSQLPFRIRPGAPTNSIFIQNNGDIGFGTASPSQAMNMVRTDASATNFRIENSNAAAQSVNLQLENAAGRWDFRNNTAGNFLVTLGGSGITELEIDGGTGDVTLGADLITGGAGTCAPPNPPCDGVFDPDVFTLESIEENAAYMWQNQHLKGVGPTRAGEPINLTKKTTGMLHELEKAHIYIDQLNGRVKELEALVAQLTADRR